MGIALMGLLGALYAHYMAASPSVIYTPDPIYDFIIVGAGTAGCVLAARLTENPAYKVLLIEAGGEEPWLTNLPLAGPLLQSSRHDWSYKTLPQKYSSNALNDKVRFLTD